MKYFKELISILISALLLLSCSATKFVADDEFLLNDVDIVSQHDANLAVKAGGYIRQHPNSKWFSLLKVPLYTYSLSGRDTTKWGNRTLRKVGEAPVIYNREQAEQTRLNIENMMRNEGYLHATVDLEERIVGKKRKDAVFYLHERERYQVSDFLVEIKDSVLAKIVLDESEESLMHPGMPFSVDNLEAERRRIATLLKDRGYYKFTKNYITFVADTAYHSTKVRLKMIVSNPIDGGRHKQYRINDVNFVSDAGLRIDNRALQGCDTLLWDKYKMLYNDDLFLSPRAMADKNYIEPGMLYSQSRSDRTYNSFAQLPAVRYTSLRMVELPDTSMLDCYIMFERNKRRSISFELEGTNTAGDLGAAASVTFSDRNLFRASEQLSLRLFGAYEAISGLSGYSRDSYYEYGAEISLRLFGGVFSSLVPAQERLLKSSTLFSLKFNSQERPEFDRQILSGAWSYQWSNSQKTSHKLDVIDINYIYVPWISDTFKKEYLDSISNRNSILKYNYENLLITKLGYSFTYNSAHANKRAERMAFALRTNLECSGNLLRGMNSLFGGHRNSDGQYTFMNIAYAQYVKGDVDFAAYVNIDDRNTLVFHMGLGLAYPYGNSTVLPFEKRYFAGGANGMRGWTVRGLGPGSYKGSDKNIDFINQSGDLKLDWNIELRSHLFWKLHSALFVDAGNIWTLRSYKEQPGGQFDIRGFHKDIAFSYGMGLRFELDLFVFRLDAGMKALNPAYHGKERYPILNPDFGRDFALHFAVGYPF